MYHSFFYIVVLRRVILYCWCETVQCIAVVMQQWLVAKWLVLGATVRVKVRARDQEMELVLLFSLLKVTKAFVLLSWYVNSTMFTT